MDQTSRNSLRGKNSTPLVSNLHGEMGDEAGHELKIFVIQKGRRKFVIRAYWHILVRVDKESHKGNSVRSRPGPRRARRGTAKSPRRDETVKRSPSSSFIPTCRATLENDRTGRQTAVRPRPGSGWTDRPVANTEEKYKRNI